MNGAYVYTPAIWLPLAGALVLSALGVYAWRRAPRRAAATAAALAVGWLFRVLWLIGMALEEAALDPGTKIFWFKFQAVWQLPAATAGLCFVLEYAFPGRWLTRRLMSPAASQAGFVSYSTVDEQSRRVRPDWRRRPFRRSPRHLLRMAADDSVPGRTSAARRPAPALPRPSGWRRGVAAVGLPARPPRLATQPTSSGIVQSQRVYRNPLHQAATTSPALVPRAGPWHLSAQSLPIFGTPDPTPPG